MEELVEEIKSVVPLKPTTDINDIVLIVGQNPQMILYAIVNSIERDSQKKDEWWNIGLTFLTVPLQKVVWTLRTVQMTGQEIFTMGGEKRFFQAVEIEKNTMSSPKKMVAPENKKPIGLKRIK